MILLLVETCRQMDPQSVIVSEIRSQRFLKVPSIQDHKMVQAVSSYGTYLSDVRRRDSARDSSGSVSNSFHACTVT